MTRKIWVVGLAVVVVVLAAWLILKTLETPKQDGSLKTVRIAVTPYQDTTLMLYGIKNGFFRDYGIDLQVRDSTWNEQIEFVAGGGCDIAMATIDEVVAKSKNLRKVNRRVVYFMPAWIFEGMIFVCRGGFQTLDELREKYGAAKASKMFLEQLKDKKIAVPEGGVYEQALRKFIRTAGGDPDSFTFINSKLEVGINGLEDPNVGIAAAGIVQRLEAGRRGYKIALKTEDLGVLVLTGFVCRAELYDRNPELVAGYLCGWYKSVRVALDNMDENYRIVREYLDGRGATVPSPEDLKAALTFQRIATTPGQAKAMFLDPNSPAYWKISWEAAVQNLKDTGKASEAPETSEDFVGEQLCPLVQRICGG
jgi:ABC-type nitrate/sulfonate/bicarbonate transport system substrate-binding protein